MEVALSRFFFLSEFRQLFNPLSSLVLIFCFGVYLGHEGVAFFNEIAGFETSSRPYFLEIRRPPATPTPSFDSPMQTRNYREALFL